MSLYTSDYRTLSVWECFDAKGKFCHDRNYDSMMLTTGSSNKGHGVCCKMDYEGDHCSNSDINHDCSTPAEIIDQHSEYSSILSPGKLNYQMFAFNTIVNHKSCGLSDDSSNSNMTLIAGTAKKKVSSKQMKYKEGVPDYRQYDACYY